MLYLFLQTKEEIEKLTVDENLNLLERSMYLIRYSKFLVSETCVIP